MAGHDPATHAAPQIDCQIMSSEQCVAEIKPTRIGFRYQSRFPSASPMLDVFLALECADNRLVTFMIREPLLSVMTVGPVDRALAVPPDASSKIGRHADIQRPIRTVGHNVGPSSSHCGSFTPWVAGSSPAMTELS
jgi:hypothetical protein